MRTILPHGPHQCQSCGATGRHNGPYWGNSPVVIDLGDCGAPPMEPDMTIPVRCDACEFAAKVRADFAADPAFAEQIYCVAAHNVERYLARELRERYH